MLLMFFLLTASINAGPVYSQSLETFFPTPGCIGGWAIKGKIDIYTEENLYKYINGEAEFYYPYGFKTLATTLYVQSDNPEIGIVAEIYEMGSSVDAFGIYSRYRDPDEESVSIGTEGFVNDSQLLFAKNRYFVRLSPSGTVTLEKLIFLACAQSIAKNIPDDSSPRTVLDIIRIPEIVPKTETYIVRGVLGYSFFRKGLAADARLNDKTIRIFVVFEDSPRSAEKAFNEYKTYLEKSQADFSVSTDGNTSTINARDPLYKGLALMRSGSILIGVAKLDDPMAALPVIEKLKSSTPAM